jgi:hypothetical protein
MAVAAGCCAALVNVCRRKQDRQRSACALRKPVSTTRHLAVVSHHRVGLELEQRQDSPGPSQDRSDENRQRYHHDRQKAHRFQGRFGSEVDSDVVEVDLDQIAPTVERAVSAADGQAFI